MKKKSARIMLLRPEQITADRAAQLRVQPDDEAIADYAEKMKAGAKFDLIECFTDGATIWVWDGFHRLAGAKRAGVKIRANVAVGTRRDAILFSVGANQRHGVRRKNADKRKAVETLLLDEEWSKWSNAEIAKRCGVSDHFVGDVRRELSPNKSEIGGRRVRRNGAEYEMETGAIGPEPKPPAPRVTAEGSQLERDEPQPPPDDGLIHLAIRVIGDEGFEPDSLCGLPLSTVNHTAGEDEITCGDCLNRLNDGYEVDDPDAPPEPAEDVPAPRQAKSYDVEGKELPERAARSFGIVHGRQSRILALIAEAAAEWRDEQDDVTDLAKNGALPNDVDVVRIFGAGALNVVSHLQEYAATIRQSLPHAVCQTCEGHGFLGDTPLTGSRCGTCAGIGWLPAYVARGAARTADVVGGAP